VRRVVVKRANNGHFAARGEINGTSVTFLFDTGASHVSIPQEVAQRIGLERGEEVRYSTANGVANGYLTNLDKVSVGKIDVDDVRGSINPNVDHEVVLLGMSFLGELEFTQRNDRLILRQKVTR
jgi:aspartyl protease family protein